MPFPIARNFRCCCKFVLNHNRPAFCRVAPRLFEVLGGEDRAKQDLDELLRRRLAVKDTAVEVDLEQP